MNRYRTPQSGVWTALIALAILAGQAKAAPSLWNIHGIESDGTAIQDISDATRLLDGQIPSSVNVTGQSAFINFNELTTPTGGLFGNDTAFPGTSTGHQENFAAEATGTIHIPAAGAYTFGVSSDDGFALKVGSFSSSFTGQRAAGETYSTFIFPKAGDYPVDLTYFQHLRHAELEFFASPGSFTAFGQKGSNFQLVGNGSNGGLSLIPSSVSVGASLPEPAGIALGAPLIVMGLLLRRRGPRSFLVGR